MSKSISWGKQIFPVASQHWKCLLHGMSSFSLYLLLCLQTQPKGPRQHTDHVRTKLCHISCTCHFSASVQCWCIVSGCVCLSVPHPPAPLRRIPRPGRCSQPHRVLSRCPQPPVTPRPSGGSAAFVWLGSEKREKTPLATRTPVEMC